MFWIPHRSPLTPEAYEKLPLLRKAWRGLYNEARLSRNLLRKRDVVRFVLFAQGRTGSTLFTSSMDLHSRVRCYDELLGNPRLFPKQFLNHVAYASGAEVFGCHVKIYQLAAWQRIDNIGRFMRDLYESGWKIVYLRRENLLRHVVSNIFAETAGSYHDKTGKLAKPDTIVVPLKRLLNDIEIRRAFLAAEEEALGNIPHLRLVYELDFQEPQSHAATFRRVQDYLGIPYEDVGPTLNKMVSTDLSNLIENYDEIETALKDRPEQQFLLPGFEASIER